MRDKREKERHEIEREEIFVLKEEEEKSMGRACRRNKINRVRILISWIVLEFTYIV